MLQTLKEREECFSTFSQQESFDSVEGLVTSEEEIDKAAWKRSESAHHVMCLLTLRFFKDLHGFLGKNPLYASENDKIFEWSAVEQFFVSSATACVCDSW